MKNSKKLLNQSGMTMIELLMATAGTAALALTITKLMENSSQNMKQIEAKGQNIDLKGLIQNTLSTPSACKNTFSTVINSGNLATLSGSPTAFVPIPGVKDKTNTTKYSTASTNVNPLKINAMNLTNWNSAAGTADLVVQSSYQKSANQLVAVKPLTIPMSFTVDNSVPATPNLTNCSASAIGGEWLLTGNAGTVDGTDYMGTSDAQPLNFRVNNQKAGRIDISGYTSFGFQAGNAFPGLYSTAIGHQASAGETGGGQPYNTAIGYRTMARASGDGNTAVGAEALSDPVTGTGPDEIVKNTAIGKGAMRYIQAAYLNTCVGHNCLANRGTGDNNVHVGASIDSGAAGAVAGGNGNVTLGAYSGKAMQNAHQNIIIGTDAGAKLVNGNNNIIIGQNAGANIAAATNNALYIDSSNPIGNPLIGGDFVNRTTSFDGTVTIGQPTGTPILPSGDPADPNLKLLIGTGNPLGRSRAVVDVYSANPSSGRIYGVKVQTDTGFDWNYAMHGTAYSSAGNSGYSVGVKGSAVAAVAAGSGQAFGGYFTASNSTDGYNYGMVAHLGGTAKGTAIWASSDSASVGGQLGIPTNTLAGQNQSWAGVFYGDIYQLGRVFQTGDTTQVGNHTATSHPNVSDERLKKNIKPLENSLEKILKLQGVSYDWKDEKRGGHQVGVIAQAVEKVYPQVVLFDKNDDKKMRSVNYSGLVAPLIESVKELYAMIVKLISSDDAQNEEIKKLKAENEKLKQEMRLNQESFEARLKKLEAKAN